MSSALGGAGGAVGIVGAGRMGRALASRIVGEHELVVVSRRTGRIELPEAEIPITDGPAALGRCVLVLLAVPADEVSAALAWAAPHLGGEALAVNLATELPTSQLFGLGVRVVGCKIIGQSGRIAQGMPAALVVDGATEAELALLTSVLGGVGVVLDASESLVAQVNDRVARTMISAQLELVRELDALGLPAQARSAALENLAVGTWQTVAAGTPGPFLRKILAQLQAAEAV